LDNNKFQREKKRLKKEREKNHSYVIEVKAQRWIYINVYTLL